MRRHARRARRQRYSGAPDAVRGGFDARRRGDRHRADDGRGDGRIWPAQRGNGAAARRARGGRRTAPTDSPGPPVSDSDLNFSFQKFILQRNSSRGPKIMNQDFLESLRNKDLKGGRKS